jgi:hypothetical protein
MEQKSEQYPISLVEKYGKKELPQKLTEARRRVINEIAQILADIESKHPKRNTRVITSVMDTLAAKHGEKLPR